jgi:hypothetical protein|tara:strand:- start:262 stop:510 length:249 start_codon:yes stop_codon:yes gene_type:complete
MSIFGIALRGYGMLKKGKKAYDTIKSVKVGKNLKKKRDIQDSVVKSKDKTIAVLNEEGKRNVRTKVKLSDTNKKIADIVDKK